MNAEFEYLKRMAKWGGPEENQYDELNAVFQSINRDRKLGMIQDHEIETVWHSLPDVFYSLDTMQGFATVKPYGYPGDFEIVERIYHCWKSSNSQLVNWDHFFHAQMAPGAVRNRRYYYLNLLHSLNTTKQSKRVLDIASGPATGVIEFLSGNDGSVCFECVDFDKNAIECASKKSQHVGNFVRFHCVNAFHFASEHNFDLVWSAGLFDYLDDRAFKILLKKLLGFVAMDGELVLGNFSPENSTRDYMEFGNWHLIHRSADELIRLAKESGIPEEKISIRSEPLGVNLFLHIAN